MAEEVGCCVGVATEPAGVVPPGMISGRLPLMSPSVFSSKEIDAVPKSQLAHEEQLEDSGLLVVVVSWSSFCVVEGLPSSPMVSVG